MFFSADLATKKLHTVSFTPRLEIVGTYDFAGRVLVLPIVGNGFFNITMGKYLHSLLDPVRIKTTVLPNLYFLQG